MYKEKKIHNDLENKKKDEKLNRFKKINVYKRTACTDIVKLHFDERKRKKKTITYLRVSNRGLTINHFVVCTRVRKKKEKKRKCSF